MAVPTLLTFGDVKISACATAPKNRAEFVGKLVGGEFGKFGL